MTDYHDYLNMIDKAFDLMHVYNIVQTCMYAM